MDCGGAEKLLGRGDMLFHANGASKPVRAQAAFVSDEEVESIMDFFTRQQTDENQPRYQEITLDEVSSTVDAVTGQGNGKQEDELLDDAVKDSIGKRSGVHIDDTAEAQGRLCQSRKAYRYNGTAEGCKRL